MKRLYFLLLAGIFLYISNNTLAQDTKFQSLIIYNLTKLLDWPDKSGNFTIKIIGNTELTKELKEFTNERKAGGKQDFDIQKVEIGNIDNCHILFIGAQDCANTESIVKTVGSKPVLVITEKPDLTSKGAGISLDKMDGVWKFQYSEENIKKAGIKISMDFKELGIPK